MGICHRRGMASGKLAIEKPAKVEIWGGMEVAGSSDLEKVVYRFSHSSSSLACALLPLTTRFLALLSVRRLELSL